MISNVTQNNKVDHKCKSCHQDMSADDNITCLVPEVVIDGVEHRRRMYRFDCFEEEEEEVEIYDSNGRCVAIQYAPLEVGHDKQKWGEEEQQRCHDCNIKLGAIHHAGCDMEICPSCNNQLISCDCTNKAFPILEEEDED
jgi:hypothetical protein